MMLYTVFHKVCLMPAFHYDEVPKPGDRISAEKVTRLNGTRPTASARGMLCGSCGTPLRALDLLPDPSYGIKTYNMADEQDMEILYGKEAQ